MLKLVQRVGEGRIIKILSAVILASVLILSGTSISDRANPTPDGLLEVGIGQKIITVGSIAYAAGTADYTTDGVDDNVQFQAALDALPVAGGKISVLTGNYVFSATVTRAIPNVTIEGNGLSTNFTYDAVNPIFTAGGNNWVFANFVVDAGGINMGATTGWMQTHVLLGATYYAYRSPYGQSVFNNATVASLVDSGLTSGRVPIAGVGGLLGDSANLTWANPSLYVGGANVTRSATYIVAASNAPAHVRAQADFVADGTADNVEIQAAINALPFGGGSILLSEGTFTIASPIVIQPNTNSMTLRGSGLSTVITPANNANVDGITFASNAGNIIIESLTLEGNKANEASGNAIDLSNTYNMRFRDLHISSWRESGLYMLNTIANPNLGSLYFDTVLVYASDGDGVYINGEAGITAAGLYATKLVISGSGGYGLRILNFFDPVFSQSGFDSNANTGFWAENDVNYLRIENSFVGGNNFTGIDLDATHRAIITGNSLQENRNIGVAGGVSIDVGGNSYQILIENNDIQHTLETSNIGVWVRSGATKVSITGNNFDITSGSPVVLVAPEGAGIIAWNNIGYDDIGLRNLTNLLGNGSFEVGDPLAIWSAYYGGETVVRSTVQARIGNNSVSLTNAGASAGAIWQDPINAGNYTGRRMTLGSWVWASTASRVRVALEDGSGLSYSGYHTGGSTWEWLTITKTNTGWGPRAVLHIATGGAITAYFDGVILVEGDSAPAFTPRPLDDSRSNSGIAVILNGNNAVNVNHGLSTNATGIWLTSTHNETGLLYITGGNVTSFTINSANNVTANRNVYWRAIVGAGN